MANKLRILAVTGTLAEPVVKHFASQCLAYADVEVCALPRPVAALMTTDYIAKELARRGFEEFDAILLPGLSIGSAELVEEATGIAAYKGPRYASDIPEAVEALAKGIVLSKQSPSDEVLSTQRFVRETEALKSLEGGEVLASIGEGSRRVSLVRGARPKLFAEVVDATSKPFKKVLEIAKRFLEEGADAIDVGCLASEPNPRRAAELVRRLREVLPCPICVDTGDIDEAVEAALAGADVVLSIGPDRAKRIPSALLRKAIVITPVDGLSEEPPPTPEEAVSILAEAVEAARSQGAKAVLADPLIKPPCMGLADSIVAYHLARSALPDTPLLMGFQNVTELVDADSIGANALLASLACELGVSAVLTAEASPKTRGCVGEVRIALEMAALAKAWTRPPKDFARNLFVAKSKRLPEQKPHPSPHSIVHVAEPPPHRLDPAGYFKIFADLDRGELVLEHYPLRGDEPDEVARGKSAKALWSWAAERGLVSTLDHAAYLGYELAKAEAALRLGKPYVQDQPLF